MEIIGIVSVIKNQSLVQTLHTCSLNILLAESVEEKK